MSDTVEVSYGASRKKNSVFNVVIRLFVYCSLDCLSLPSSIIWMNTLLTFFPRKHALFRIEAVYGIPFFGYMQCASFSDVPGPTSRMCELLRLCKMAAPLPRLVFSPPAFRHVHPGPHVLNEVAGWVEKGVSYHLDVSDLAAGMDDSVIRLVVEFGTPRCRRYFPDLGLIIRVDALQECFKSRQSVARIKT